MPYSSFREEELFLRIKWFIRLRWIFLIGLIFTVVLADKVFKVALPITSILLVGLGVFIYNFAFYFFHAFLRKSSEEGIGTVRFEANLQISLDLLSMTLLIHFSGGVENPFIFFYLFHAIIGSILLSRAEVYLQGLLAVVLFSAFVALEYFGVIPHYHLVKFFPGDSQGNWLYVGVVCLVLTATLFTTIFMSSTIVQGLRVREKELFETRGILQKKSEDLAEANLKLLEKQKQLVQSEKLASLGQLVSGIAHEINNPVQFILGNIHIFKEAFEGIFPILDEYAVSHPDLTLARLKYFFFREHLPVLLNDIAKGAERIRNIIADLKTFARRDEGRLDEEVDLNEVARICQRLLYNKIKRLKVEEDLDPNLARVQGSPIKLEQVVMGTLINAAEALADRPEGAIRIITRNEDGGKSVRIAISDNGPGITEEVKRKIFDPFFTTKQRSGGTGLGLSITYGIIEEHHGRIEVESDPAQGTTFTYHLPAKGQPGE